MAHEDFTRHTCDWCSKTEETVVNGFPATWYIVLYKRSPASTQTWGDRVCGACYGQQMCKTGRHDFLLSRDGECTRTGCNVKRDD
jgi:hypothetical protein